MQNFQVRSPDNSAPPPAGADRAGRPDKIDRDPRGAADRPQMSMIGADIVITGNIEASVDLHIEGRVIGDVRCATLILGEGSKVNGDIRAERVRVAGMVEGSIETRDLAVEAAARVSGEIAYERLRVASGAIMEGTFKCNPPQDSGADAKLKLVDAKPEPRIEAAPAPQAPVQPVIVIE
ncbi:MAG TPA: polymer-forming cytoskeletal protein [Allosphingosinicella sp.]|nr:polymer-forming cytoskeletal protein [Allosphingosinicella sp.]